MTTEIVAGSESKAIQTPRTRWWLGGVILGLGIAAQTVFVIRFAEDPTFTKMSVLWVWPATLFALLLWWLFASGLRWRTKLIPLAALAGLMVLFFSIYRIDGSDGDMVPRLAYRWTPTAAEVAKEYWKLQPTESVAEVESQTPEAEDVAAVIPAMEPGPDDWADFRGPRRDGVIRGSGFRTDWETRPPVEVWRHPVGLGWSSFSVLGDLAITMEQRDDRESVVCYSLATGEPVWIQGDVTRFTAVEVNGGDGPHATPVIVGEETYTLGATGLLNCRKTRTGERIWSRNILDDAGADGVPAQNLEWGVSGTPVIVDDLVVAIPGGTAGKSVIAYDRMTGEIRWAQGNFPASYGGPRVEELGGYRQLLAFHGTGISAFSHDEGKLLWEFPWENLPKVNAAQPIKLDDASLVIGSGYGKGATRLDLSKSADSWNVEQGWKTNRLKLKFNDALLLNDHLYGLDDGILTCVDPASGKTKWKAQRFGYGQLLGFENTLLILSEDGDAVIAAADPAGYQELGRIHVLDGTTWNHPVVAQGRLLVRNGNMAACYDVAP